MTVRNVFLLLSSLALAACAVGPDYVAPENDVSATWLNSTGGQALPDTWWAELDDDALAEYLAIAALNNRDIGIAAARVDEARALRGIARPER